MALPSTRLNRPDGDLRSAFLALRFPTDVAELLEVPLKTLSFYVFKKQNYKRFLLKRASGIPRVISVPDTPLKIIQRKLSQILYAVYGSRSAVHGFAKGRSIKSNATRHIGSQWVMNFDLQDFFPSIHFGRVLGMFEGKPYNLPRPVAVVLARICCYEGSLPIGAPTSPITANLICAQMDSKLKALSKACGCVYTRYADDITFSTKASIFDKRIAEKSLSKSVWDIGTDVLAIVEGNSFKINPSKTRARSKQSSQEVTGIRINSGLNVNRKLHRQVRSMLHAWEKFGEEAAQNEFTSRYQDKQRRDGITKFRDVLRGKIDFIGFVKGRDDRVYVNLLQRLQSLSGQHAKPIIIGPSTHESIMRQGIWLLMNKSGEYQGTAFALEGNRLFTAAHNMNDFMWASRPNFDNTAYPVEIVQRNDERDIAEVRISSFLPVQFAASSPEPLALMSSICVAGFPNYHEQDSVAFRFGKIVQERHYISGKHENPNESAHVKHYIVDADIVKGNSGGPVLNPSNRVIGIAVKGLDVSGKIGQKDQLSSFVPFNPLLFPPATAKKHPITQPTPQKTPPAQQSATHSAAPPPE